MKYLFSLLTIFFLVVSCSKSDKEMHLTGHVKGLKKGTLLLQKFEDTILTTVDSVQVNGDSSFEFSEEINSPEIYYLYLRLKDGTLIDDRITFFAEPSEITINTTLKSFELDAKITGSKNEDALNDYKKLMKRYSDKNLDHIESGLKALQEGNDSLVSAIEGQRSSLKASKYFMTVNFAINHKEYELAPYLALTEIYDANPKYLDTVYNTLTPKIKDSKYGTALESYIKEVKKEKN
ncbi:DUF4369 domain-containing protein [Ulvibacter litoralis]|uniref:DUF4369 domain-containing protein n=1 Tax=Ulvibacter litoralis TaxID=227084 RepID=A0A1G7IWR7_9FLAO|nr:DUF4369 domain-containing protein [Ulvibacter litoralis]GHC64903.1 hypothetical protein GCM10008083_32710 [Ulvibacter litoralis]SDF17016.1 protein of unknown function [Ulvibacter litoralis]